MLPPIPMIFAKLELRYELYLRSKMTKNMYKVIGINYIKIIFSIIL